MLDFKKAHTTPAFPSTSDMQLGEVTYDCTFFPGEAKSSFILLFSKYIFNFFLKYYLFFIFNYAYGCGYVNANAQGDRKGRELPWT